MKFNATYRYRNSGTGNAFVNGGECFVVVSSMEQLIESDWGHEKELSYTLFVNGESRKNVSLGTYVEVTLQDNSVVFCTVTGVDNTINRLYTFSIKSSTPYMSMNGSVRFIASKQGGIDSGTGYPVQPTIVWDRSVRCHYKKVEENLQAKSQGEPYVKSNYDIYLTGEVFPSERLKLISDNQLELGIFSVITYEYDAFKGITKISV